ncbi:uncharacterized protein METZ01_LOCUS434737, partial [marine metagenome]
MDIDNRRMEYYTVSAAIFQGPCRAH